MKKIFVFLGFFLSFILVSKAEIFNGTVMGDIPIDNISVKKTDRYGNVQYRNGRILRIVETNEFIYCLEPFVLIDNDVEYEVFQDNVLSYIDLSEEDFNKVNLLSYYGYGYKDEYYDHTSMIWYYITQVLIWRTTYKDGLFEFTENYKGNVNNNLYLNEVLELENLVNNNLKTPKFEIPEIWDMEYSFEDLNNVLSNYEVIDNEQVKIDGNRLLIDATNHEDLNFTLKRKNYLNTGYLYYSTDSQIFMKGIFPINIQDKYNVKVKQRLGKINVLKMGEEINLDNNTYYYEYKPLEKVRFELLNEDYEVISSGETNDLGVITFEDIPVGKYYLKEILESDEYIPNKLVEVEVVFDEYEDCVIDVDTTIYNDLKKGNILIKKIDSEENPLEGVKFMIKGADFYLEKNTNELGLISLDNLKVGLYEIIELEPLEGFTGIYDEFIYLDDEDLEVVVENFKEIFVPDTSIGNFTFEILVDPKYLTKKMRQILEFVCYNNLRGYYETK